MAFGTRTYAKKLQEAGVPPRQAEVHAEALKELVEGNLATKQDIEALRLEIELVRKEMKEMETGLRRNMKEMEERLFLRIEILRRDVLIKLRGIVIAGFTVTAALIGVVIAMIQ